MSRKFRCVIQSLCFLYATTLLMVDGVRAFWETSEYGDAFDDQQRVLAVTRNQNKDSLVLKCVDYMDDVYLAFYLHDYIDNDERKVARVRFDKNDIFQINGWADGRLFAVFDNSDLRVLIQGMRKYQTVAVEVKDYDYGRIVASFSLEGYTLAEKEVSSTCKLP